MANLTVAQPSEDSSPPVVDTDAQPLERGVEYYIPPNNSSQNGGLTLVDRNNSCPLYVGQGDDSRLPVTFTPFLEGETIVRESSDFSVAFSAPTICIQSLAWRVGDESDLETGRRLILTGGDRDYFRIDKDGEVYNLAWCPSSDACPTCRPRCGIAGILIENEKRLLALDGPTLPVVFKRV